MRIADYSVTEAVLEHTWLLPLKSLLDKNFLADTNILQAIQQRVR